MIRKIKKICIPVMMRQDLKWYFGIDFCMRIFILLQPALALPVFLNLMLTAYEAGRFHAMVWYGVVWFVLGGLFLVGRYRFDILVNGKFYYKTIENIRDICLGEIYDKKQEVPSDYDGNPYFAFLQEGVEEFTLALFRVDRGVAILLVTAGFFLWCAHISLSMAMLALAGGMISVLVGNLASKKLSRKNDVLFQQRAEVNGALRNLFYGTETYLVKGKYRHVRNELEGKITEMNRQSCRNAERASLRTNGLRIIDCTVYAVMILWCFLILREKSAAVILTMISAYETMKRYENDFNSVWMRTAEKEYIMDRYEDLMAKRQEPEKGVSASKSHVIEVDHLCYQANGSEILKDINMEIGQNEKVALIGMNGAGKSTLLKCILGLLEPGSGEIRRSDDLVFSYIPVHPQLFPVSILENIQYASGSETADKNAIMEAADILRIDSIDAEQALADGEENLSGGEAQRVAIARAFAGASSGQIIIADEPTANLDIKTERKVLEELLKYSTALIFTTHNPALVGYADKVYLMKKGEIAANGTPEEVCHLAVYQEWARDSRRNTI